MQILLSKAIQQLVEHPESDRIHKLLYWVCKGKWESASSKLDGTSIELLLPELVQNAPTFEVLERRIHKAASVLNKTNTYMRIATLIVYHCADFYASLATQCDADDAEDMFTCVVLNEKSDPKSGQTSLHLASNRFELRRLLMQQIPPLKIKILLFSTLRHPFSFSPHDWAQIKSQTLDEWITELVETFSVMSVLEQQLITQARELKTLDQGPQIADIIIQALRLKVR